MKSNVAFPFNHFSLTSRGSRVWGGGGAVFEQGPGDPDGQRIAWLIYIWTKIVGLAPNVLILKDQITSDLNQKAVSFKCGSVSCWPSNRWIYKIP